MGKSRRRFQRAGRPSVPPGSGLDPATSDWLFRKRHQRLLSGSARAVRRAAFVFAWTLPAMAIQSGCLLLPGPAKVRFARFYWAGVCRLLGMQVRVIGAPAGHAERPVVFVSNHSSWLDVPVLGSRVPACFIAKGEVAGWPFVGWVAKLGRTEFVSRQRGATGRERDAMRHRLAKGDNLVLFPEGTTSDGSRVMPFRSAFFAVAEGSAPPLIQPVSVVYDRLAGLPTGRASRPLFSWYGDMDLAGHYWRLARHRGMRATVLLHTPIDPAAFADRKALTRAVWTVVADGAATLRQNRPATPLAGPAQDVSGGEERPAYA
ncbi:MAG: 1-acyl-sn-glycerol-3-phosphate acyltransferase [Rhodospirillales bacterium]|jgi:1-acyl-sn-glycerol-3-phosphate acyltransferase|nr:1-acyl-sn-glycerol-3-phosphate acyltransferase [Rhodospirillales bacterium]